MSEDLLESSMLVSEQTAAAIETHLLLIECSTVFGLELVIADLAHESV